MDISHQELKRMFDYNPKTGAFHWNISSGSTAIGAPAGFGVAKLNANTGMYENGPPAVIHCKGRSYPAHKVAWFYIYGTYPTKRIHHADGNQLNNAKRNLWMSK